MNTQIIRNIVLASAFAAMSVVPAFAGQDAMMTVKSGKFMGVEAKTGTVSFMEMNGKATLALSPDFKIPATPAPHWQVVDKENNIYTLQNLKVAPGKNNRKITLPSYIHSVSKVRIWCTFAEVNLGEASFAKPIEIKGM
ncbi:MAG: hypothetical protein ACOYON_15255 [Fimbriimonas sp.]